MSREEDANAFNGSDYVYPGGPLWDGISLVQDRPPVWPV